MKIIAAPGTNQQTIRLLAPGNTQSTTQLMTLVKTANGAFRLLPQSSAGPVTGANIVKTIAPISSNQTAPTTQGTATSPKVIPTIFKTMPGQSNIVTLSKSPMTTIQNTVSTTSISGQPTKTIIIPSKSNQPVVQQPTVATSTTGTMITNPAGLKYVVIQAPNSQTPTTNQQIIMNQPQPITLQLPNSVVSTSSGAKTITIPASALQKPFSTQSTPTTVQTSSGQKIIQLPPGTQLPPGIRFIQPSQMRTISAASGTSPQQKIVLIPQSNASPTLKQQIVTLPSSAVVSTGSETPAQTSNNADQSKITQLDGPLDEAGSNMETEAKKDEPASGDKMEVDGKEPEEDETKDESSNKDEVKIKTEPSDSADTKPQLLFASFNDMIGMEPPALLCADDPEPPSLPASAANSSTVVLPSPAVQTSLVKDETKESSPSAISQSQSETNTDPLSTLASAAVSSQSQPINNSTTSTDSVKLESSTTTNSNSALRSTNSTENKPNTNSLAGTSLTITKTDSQSSSQQSLNRAVEPTNQASSHPEANQENQSGKLNPPANSHDSAPSAVNPKLLTKKNQWYDVDVFKSNTCTVSGYYLTQDSHDHLLSDNLSVENEFKQLNYSQFLKVDLEPGTTYKFRVAGLNSCGRGPWSEVSAFQTGLPGHPGAPSAIKITTNQDASGALNAILSWDPPQFTSGTITGYLVQLSVKTNQGSNFVPVYCDKDPSCTVNSANLQQAFIDMSTNKPAILFRISARNEKGFVAQFCFSSANRFSFFTNQVSPLSRFGPSTQVRWLQDSTQGVMKSNKRQSSEGNASKRIKSES